MKIYSYPDHKVAVVDGTPIDLHDDLDEIWRGKPNTTTGDGGGTGGSQDRGRLDESALLADIIAGRAYHQSSVRLLGRWASNGVTYMDARERVLAAFDQVPAPNRDARWHQRRSDVDRCLEDIYAKEAAKGDSAEEAASKAEPDVGVPTAEYWLMGRHRLVCGDRTEGASVALALNGVRPHLMITDPPYGVDYDPAWRNRAGLSTTERTGKVLNDDRADWREAWALWVRTIRPVSERLISGTPGRGVRPPGACYHPEPRWVGPRRGDLALYESTFALCRMQAKSDWMENYCDHRRG